MARFGAEIGRALRHARRERGFTLRDLERASHGRFKPSSVAGYERGERSISLDRFCELVGFYGIPPDRLLADILTHIAPQGRQELVIDLDRLILILGEEGERVAAFVQNVKAQRGDHLTDVITLRSGDLEALAMASHMKPSALLSKLLPALRGPKPEAR